MKLFACPVCQEPLHFENSQCTRCGHLLAFVPEHARLTAVEPVADAPGLFVALGLDDDGARYRACGNRIDHEACNWTVTEGDEQRFCLACRLNEIIPNLAEPAAKEAWLKLERSKRRLIYTLMALGLPIEPRSVRPGGLAFAFKQDLPGQQPVMIGHDDGLITINMLVAADALLIPLQCEYYALEGLSQLLNTVHRVQHSANEELAIDGVLLTMYDSRLNLSKQVAEDAREYFGPKVFKNVVPRNVRLAEAPSFGKPIILYDVASVGAQAYMNVAKELIERTAQGDDGGH